MSELHNDDISETAKAFHAVRQALSRALRGSPELVLFHTRRLAHLYVRAKNEPLARIRFVDDQKDLDLEIRLPGGEAWAFFNIKVAGDPESGVRLQLADRSLSCQEVAELIIQDAKKVAEL